MATIRYGKVVSVEASLLPTKDISSKRYGLNYPFIDGSNGYLSKSTGSKLIKSSISQLLKTEKGERVMLPDYGVELKKYLFDPLDIYRFNEIRDQILIAITTWILDVEVVKIGVFETKELNYTGLPGIVIRLTVKVLENNDLLEVSTTIN
jgi:phage baseplate assembly protein W